MGNGQTNLVDVCIQQQVRTSLLRRHHLANQTLLDGAAAFTQIFTYFLGNCQCVVLSADVKRVEGQFRVFARGGRDDTGREAIGWIKHCVDLGAGDVVVNSIDTDGVKGGFDLEMLAAVCQAVKVPVIASGGAGKVQDFVDLFQTLPGVDAGLAASVFHFGEIAIPHLKQTLRDHSIPVR